MRFIASLAAAENADTRWKVIEQQNCAAFPPAFPCTVLSCKSFPFNGNNRLLMWELSHFYPKPNLLSSQPLCLHLFAHPHCPDTSSSHNFQRELTKLLEPDLAQPKAWHSVHGQVASLWHTQPFSTETPLTKEGFTLSRGQENPWPHQQRLRRKSTYTAEEERILCKSLDHKNLLRTTCTWSWVFWSSQELRLL